MRFRRDMHIKLKRGRALINKDRKVIERTLFEPYGMVFTVNHLWSPLIYVYICSRELIVERKDSLAVS